MRPDKIGKSMLIGLGTDIVEIKRIENAYQKFGHNFMAKILSDRESQNLPSCIIPFLAGRFAAKEAAAKALGTGFAMGITFRQIEIATDKLGAPQLFFNDAALARARQMHVKNAVVTISHERLFAVATVILEGESCDADKSVFA